MVFRNFFPDINIFLIFLSECLFEYIIVKIHVCKSLIDFKLWFHINSYFYDFMDSEKLSMQFFVNPMYFFENYASFMRDFLAKLLFHFTISLSDRPSSNWLHIVTCLD